MQDVFSLSKKVKKPYLLKNNFYLSKIHSDEEDDCYVYRFPVYKYNSSVVLDCELKIYLPSNLIKIDCYDYNSRSLYAPFYYQEFGNWDRIMKIINTNINRELRKLNLEILKNGEPCIEYNLH